MNHLLTFLIFACGSLSSFAGTTQALKSSGSAALEVSSTGIEISTGGVKISIESRYQPETQAPAAVVIPATESKSEIEKLEQGNDPERIQQIRKALEVLSANEAPKSTDEMEALLNKYEGFRFLGAETEQSVLTKPTFDWIQNNLFSSMDKPFVGYFPLKEDGSTLGYIVVKKESEHSPIIYLVSPEGDLKHLTRRL